MGMAEGGRQIPTLVMVPECHPTWVHTANNDTDRCSHSPMDHQPLVTVMDRQKWGWGWGWGWVEAGD